MAKTSGCGPVNPGSNPGPLLPFNGDWFMLSIRQDYKRAIEQRQQTVLDHRAAITAALRHVHNQKAM